MSRESYGYHRNCRPSTLGSVNFAQNKSTFARPKHVKTLIFIMPKDSTKQLYKGNIWYFLTTRFHFLMAFNHLELLLLGVRKKVYINGTGHMTKMAAMLIYGKKNFKNLLLQNRKSYDLET